MITSIIILAIAAMVLAATQSTMFIYITMHKAQKNKCIKVSGKSSKPKAKIAKENVEEIAKEEREEIATQQEETTALSQHEKELVEKITDSLKRHNGNMKQAAKFIGMPYSTFYYYVKKHSIKGVVLDRNSERKLARINDYCKLRKNGTILADAAKAVGISIQTAYQYEVIFNNKK